MRVSRNVILVAVDLNTHHDSPILTALDLHASDPRGIVHLLNVLDPGLLVNYPDDPVLAQEEQYLSRTPALLEQRARSVAAVHGRSYPTGQVVTHARIGDVAATILQTCVDYDVDLLICGIGDHHGASHLLDRSVSAAVLRKAHCPVLIARPKNYESLSPTATPDPPHPLGTTLPAPPCDASMGTRVTSTTLDSWEPADNGPTGFRIV